MRILLPRDAMLARHMLSLCCRRTMSIYLSATSRYCTKIVRQMITETTLYDSPGTLVFWRQRSQRNSSGVTPNGGPKYMRSRLKSAISTNISLCMSETVQDKDIVTMNTNRKWYTLYRMALFYWPWMTPNYPKPPDFSYFASSAMTS